MSEPIDWENIFKAEDFQRINTRDFEDMGASTMHREMADIANARFREILEQCPVVWICDGEIKTAHLAQPVDATHSARLIAIKETK